MTRIALSWICYWAGDLVSRLMLLCDRCRLYYPYHILMDWAYDLQGDDPRGPWELTEEVMQLRAAAEVMERRTAALRQLGNQGDAPDV
jgi:hypothetical protein